MGGPPLVIFRGKNDFRINRNSVGDEYGAGNPEVRVDSERGVFRYGRKRDFSPCVYRGLGERSTVRASTRNARKVVLVCLIGCCLLEKLTPLYVCANKHSHCNPVKRKKTHTHTQIQRYRHTHTHTPVHSCDVVGGRLHPAAALARALVNVCVYV